MEKVNPDFLMLIRPVLFSLEKAKVYLKMADIDIGGTRFFIPARFYASVNLSFFFIAT